MFGRPTGIGGWASAVAALFMVIAAVLCVAAIPAVFMDPEASVEAASGSLLMVAAVNVGLAFGVMQSKRNRAGLVVFAALASAMSLFALDGAVSLSTHLKAPAVLPPLFWGVVGADAIAAVGTIVAAIGTQRPDAPNRPLAP